MEIRDRIRMIIESQGMTAGAFADRIGVQRSNVSHVLSGRNKPGFEFLEKVLLTFPKVQAHWLLTGKQVVSQEVSDQSVTEKRMHPVTEPKQEVKTVSDKQIVKIVTFYADFTFDTYIPSGQ